MGYDVIKFLQSIAPLIVLICLLYVVYDIAVSVVRKKADELLQSCEEEIEALIGGQCFKFFKIKRDCSSYHHFGLITLYHYNTKIVGDNVRRCMDPYQFLKYIRKVKYGQMTLDELASLCLTELTTDKKQISKKVTL